MSEAAMHPAGEAPLALQIRFQERLSAGQRARRAYRDPYPRWAVDEASDVERLLGAPAVSSPPVDGFACIFLPSGTATPVEMQKRAEEWMNDPELPAEFPLADLVVQSDRILWRPGRAVVIGSPRRAEETLAGVVDFSFYEAELRRFEQELEADWTTAESDVPLTHSVDADALFRRSHVDDMTRRTALRRIRLARLTPSLEKPSPTLSGPARRLVSELALQAEVVDRLRAVDDRLEVFEDLYELANDRLGEFAYFQRESRLERWILIVLLLEVAIMLFEIWFAWWLDGG